MHDPEGRDLVSSFAQPLLNHGASIPRGNNTRAWSKSTCDDSPLLTQSEAFFSETGPPRHPGTNPSHFPWMINTLQCDRATGALQRHRSAVLGSSQYSRARGNSSPPCCDSPKHPSERTVPRKTRISSVAPREPRSESIRNIRKSKGLVNTIPTISRTARQSLVCPNNHGGLSSEKKHFSTSVNTIQNPGSYSIDPPQPSVTGFPMLAPSYHPHKFCGDETMQFPNLEDAPVPQKMSRFRFSRVSGVSHRDTASQSTRDSVPTSHTSSVSLGPYGSNDLDKVSRRLAYDLDIMKPPTSPRGGRDFCRVGAWNDLEEGEICAPGMLVEYNHKADNDRASEGRLVTTARNQGSRDDRVSQNDLYQRFAVLPYPSPTTSSASHDETEILRQHANKSVECTLDHIAASPSISSGLNHAVLPFENLELPATLDISTLAADPYLSIDSLFAGKCSVRCFLVVASEYERKGFPGAAEAVASAGVQLWKDSSDSSAVLPMLLFLARLSNTRAKECHKNGRHKERDEHLSAAAGHISHVQERDHWQVYADTSHAILSAPVLDYIQPRRTPEIPARITENGASPNVELELKRLADLLHQAKIELVIQRNAKRLAEDMLRTATISRRHLEDEIVTKTRMLKHAENEIELFRTRLVLASVIDSSERLV